MEKRQQLEQQGYKFTASIMSQSAANLNGGYTHFQQYFFENAAQLFFRCETQIIGKKLLVGKIQQRA